MTLPVNRYIGVVVIVENGERRTVWMPSKLDSLIEETRTRLGMNRSAFYKYAVIKLLQELSILSEQIHGEKKND